MQPLDGFFVVICPAFGPATVEHFTAQGDLITRLKALHGAAETQVFVFEGRNLPITTAPRHLVAAVNWRIPLFNEALDQEIDRFGYVGTPPVALADALPPQDGDEEDGELAALADEDDELDDDDDESEDAADDDDDDEEDDDEDDEAGEPHWDDDPA